MSTPPDKRKPTSAKVGSHENAKAVRASDCANDTDIARDLQALSIRKRFRVTPPVARVIADLLFVARAA